MVASGQIRMTANNLVTPGEKAAIRRCTVSIAAQATQIGQDAPNAHIRPSYVQLSIISKELLMSVIWTRGR